MNLSGIWAECGRLLSDKNNERWTTDVLTIRANIAQTEIQAATNAIKSNETLTPLVGASGQLLANAVLDVTRVYYTDSTGNVAILPGIEREQLDFLYPDWHQWPNGKPLFWMYDETNNRIQLVPPPDAANSPTNGMGVYESIIPTAMAASTDIPFGSYTPMAPYHISIVHWVVAQCFMDDATPEALAKSVFHKSDNMLRPGKYEKQISRIMAEFDNAEPIQSHILTQKEGGRVGSTFYPSKSNPLAW